MPDFSHYIIPTPHAEMEEIFGVYQATHEFYREAQHREEFEEYCQWYYQVAEQHRCELAALQGDLNLLGWFYRRT
ncbi:MAG: hypothetical protein HC769_19180 [Cyanobacteria bacterium CRU_2_1]|nr:hypothetical protein [Cyanobacteria bacterium RU_5_0]NJR60759.1 hypothetical protein [Cyanobacteria bacterium CRU_2_1]